MKPAFRMVCFAIAVFWTLPLHARSFPELEYGYPEQPPRAFTNAQGRPDGHYPRLLKVLLERAGIAWHAASYPAPRLMKNLQTGETNFSILVRNKILDECCLYSATPVWFDELRAYWTGDKPPIRSKADLTGKNIIILSGFSYGGLINYLKDPANKIVLNPAESHEAAFAMLDAGRADYVLDYAEPAEQDALAKAPVKGLQSGIVDTVHMYLVLNKSYPDAAQTMKYLEMQFQKLWDEDTAAAYTKH
jgi:polar amino acid transport system substrate-binding protein